MKEEEEETKENEQGKDKLKEEEGEEEDDPNDIDTHPWNVAELANEFYNYATINNLHTEAVHTSKRPSTDASQRPSSFRNDTFTVFGRLCKTTVFGEMSHLLRYPLFIVLSLLLGLLTYEVGNGPLAPRHYACLNIYIFLFALTTPFISLPFFSEHRRIFYHEYLNGYYRWSAFGLAHILSNAVSSLVGAILFGLPLYFLADLHSDPKYVFYFFAAVLVTIATGDVISRLFVFCGWPRYVNVLCAFSLSLIWLILNGVSIAPEDSAVEWLFYFTPSQYFSHGLTKNELIPRTQYSNSGVYAMLGESPVSKNVSLYILIGFWFLLEVLFLFVLYRGVSIFTGSLRSSTANRGGASSSSTYEMNELPKHDRAVTPASRAVLEAFENSMRRKSLADENARKAGPVKQRVVSSGRRRSSLPGGRVTASSSVSSNVSSSSSRRSIASSRRGSNQMDIDGDIQITSSRSYTPSRKNGSSKKKKSKKKTPSIEHPRWQF